MNIKSQSRCGYCYKPVNSWEHTPHGRAKCPHCNRIPKPEQYSDEELAKMHDL